MSLTLRLKETEDTIKFWPHQFELDITVELSQTGSQKPSLRMQMSVLNKSDSPLSFTTAMHSYFVVPNVHDVAITPLHQHPYFDKVAATEKIQEDEKITFSGETDRVYFKYDISLRHKICAFSLSSLYLSNLLSRKSCRMPAKVEISAKDQAQPLVVVSQENFTGTRSFPYPASLDTLSIHSHANLDLCLLSYL